MSELNDVLRPNIGLFGRRKVFTNAKEVNATNVVKVLSDALAFHLQNRNEIQRLYEIYKGKQEILNKAKIVRPAVNNKVAVNRANEIVTFKTSYFLSESVQYVSSGGKDVVSEAVNTLNSFMDAEDKESKDKEVVDWMNICGVGIRMVVPDQYGDTYGSPICIYTLDPREAFCIYHSGIGHKKVAGVVEQTDEDGNTYYCIYTPNRYFEVKNDAVIRSEHSYLGGYIPVIEYLNNEARLGAFEIVLPLLDAINNIESNRLDNIQDFVNAYDVFQNCECSDESYKKLSSGGQAIEIKTVLAGAEAKVYRISSELSQTSTQTVVDDLYDAVLTICGMPNRNGGSSTSDTGTATIMRDGWQAAESRAKDTEKMFNRSEREFLRICLYICRNVSHLDIEMKDIKIEHARNNLSNMLSRMQILTQGLNNSKIHPKIPWVLAGIPDAEECYRESMRYYEESQRELQESLKNSVNDDENQNITE